jgi:hypothetical protein
MEIISLVRTLRWHISLPTLGKYADRKIIRVELQKLQFPSQLNKTARHTRVISYIP